MNSLVYFQFNVKLLKKKGRRRADAILAREVSKAQGWTVDAGYDEDDAEEV